jgi:hypothetical protein
VLICYYSTAFVPPSKQKYPNLLREVGFGRRVRGDAKKINMMGGILPEKQNESMILLRQISAVRMD